MTVYLGADHRGFKLKSTLSSALAALGHRVVDLGDAEYNEDDDYTDFAAAVAGKVSKESDARGILVCGSGVGVDVTANKFKGVRSVLALSPVQVRAARHDDDVNILSIASDFTTEAEAVELTKAFLETPFSGLPRHARRLEKIAAFERS